MHSSLILPTKLGLLQGLSILIALFGVRGDLLPQPTQLENVIHVSHDAGESPPLLDTMAGSVRTQQSVPNEQLQTGAERATESPVQQGELIAPKSTPREESSSNRIQSSHVFTLRSSALLEFTLESIRIDPSSSHVADVLTAPKLSLSHSVDNVASSSVSHPAQHTESSSSSSINVSYSNNPMASTSCDVPCAICREPMSRRNGDPTGQVAPHATYANIEDRIYPTDLNAIVELANSFRSNKLGGKTPKHEQLPTSILGCGHVFHTLCIEPWIKHPRETLCTCPTCRAQLIQPSSTNFGSMPVTRLGDSHEVLLADHVTSTMPRNEALRIILTISAWAVMWVLICNMFDD